MNNIEHPDSGCVSRRGMVRLRSYRPETDEACVFISLIAYKLLDSVSYLMEIEIRDI